MKKILLMAALALSVTACSQGVSEADYESVVAEKSSIEESVATEKLDRESQKLIEEQPYTVLNAWAKSAFGDSTVFFDKDNKFMQCIVLSQKDTSTESLQAIKDSVISSMKSLAFFNNTYHFEYQYINIRFLHQNNIPMIEYVFTKSGDYYDLSTFTLDAGASELIPNLLATE